MPTLHPKVSAGVVAGAITSLVVAELGRRGIQITGDEGASITVLLSFAAGYFMPPGDNGNGNGNAAAPPPILPGG